MNPARRTAAAGALLVAAGALALVAARRTPRQPWRPGVRLVDEIAAAVEVPRAPAVRRFLWLDELPRFPGARQVAVLFRAESRTLWLRRADGTEYRLNQVKKSEAAWISQALGGPLAS